jgi:hypothetical protein
MTAPFGLSAEPLSLKALDAAFEQFHDAAPFPHCVIDDFISPSWLSMLEAEFLPFGSPEWYVYKNQIEDKKALNRWDAFPHATYKFFSYMNSEDFTGRISKLAGIPLHADQGLSGGGWHIHGQGGNLNPHLDYSVHPKLGLQRKLNIIMYISRELHEEHGGHLGLWEWDKENSQLGKLAKVVQPKFNRAVIFDTTKDSWHGMCRPLTQPEGVYRKSLAVYYLCVPPVDVDPRGKALFAPREEQLGDKEIEELIRRRANGESFAEVYRQ